MDAVKGTLFLKEKGEVIASVETVSGGDEVWVGRSHQCGLRCREDDLSVSGHHARVFWDGNDLWIEDGGSRNGIYHNGEKIEVAHKFLAGEQIALGDCTLTWEREVEREGGEKRWRRTEEGCHRLELRFGKRTGERVELVAGKDGKPFSIGSAEDCSLRLQDEFVSSHHCHFEVKLGGDCWVYDDGGANGTVVNGAALRQKGRLLKDGDRISVAQFDFLFLDRTKPHRRFGLAAKVAAVLLSLALIATIYIVHSILSESASVLMVRARMAAANADFDTATELLNDVRGSREGGKYGLQVRALERQIVRWRATSAAWRKIQADLSAGEFDSARDRLEPLLCESADDWTWNGDAGLRERDLAETAAKVLHLYFDAKDAVQSRFDGRPAQGIARVREVEEKVEREGGGECDFLKPLSSQLTILKSQLSSIRNGFAEVDGILAGLGRANPDPAAAAAGLRAIADDTNRLASVRSYAERHVKTCSDLAEALKQVVAVRKLVCDLKLTDAVRQVTEVVTPPADLCAHHPQFSVLRKKIEEDIVEAQRMARALKPMVVGLRSVEPILEKACKPSVWEEALADNPFARPLPRVRREKPAGAYDDVFGIEYGYAALRALPNDPDGLVLRLMRFTPLVVSAREAFQRVRAFGQFVNAGPAWLNAGKIGEIVESSNRRIVELSESSNRLNRQIVERRSTESTSQTSQTFSNRKFLLAGLATILLSPERDEKLVERVVRERDELHRRVMDLVGHDEAAALKIAIPGDPAVHSAWASWGNRRIVESSNGRNN